jgi:hypothetical protein
VNAPAATFACEPLTPRGVAAFARARLWRLFLAQMIVALLAAISVVWFLDQSCFPAVRKAVKNLPATGEIRSGKLDWNGGWPKPLADERFLAFDVDLDHSGLIQPTADVQIEFGGKNVRVFSLLGYVEFPYPAGQTISFNSADLEPLWGAWAVEILFIAAAATLVGLMLSWWILATIYFPPVWILGFYLNRDLNFRASWKMSGAALMPGALLMAAGIFAYGFGALNLVQFGFVFGAHFVLGWIYLAVSLLFVPQISPPPPKGNPFAPRN